MFKLIKGEALRTLSQFASDAVDACITDPPYSSGGLFNCTKLQDPAKKYIQTGTKRQYPTFEGDSRDARSYRYWCQLWMSEVRRIVRPGGRFLVFTDWRQLANTIDAVQSAGWTWRGIICWDKGLGSRSPHKGYHRQQCEFIVWATRGPCEQQAAGPFPGCYSHAIRQSDKHHMTGKPTPLMVELANSTTPEGWILDPFGGSHSTGVGALLTGRHYIGIEQSAEYHEIGRARLEAAQEIEPVAA